MSYIESRTITVKNLRVYYRTAGDPKNPPLILLNGWGARLTKLPFLKNHLNSEAAVLGFARHGFYVYSPEHPGFMRSETPKTIWGPKDYVDYLKEFVEELNLEDFILVGQSFGGAIATFYAAENSDRIKTLVLVGAGLSQDKKFYLALERRRYFGWILRTNLVPKFVKKIFVSLYLGVPWSEVEKENYERRSIMWDIFANWSLPNVYAKIRVRTILVWGTHDRLIPLSSAQEVVKEVPNAELYTLVGGHGIFYTQSQKVVDCIAKKL